MRGGGIGGLEGGRVPEQREVAAVRDAVVGHGGERRPPTLCAGRAERRSREHGCPQLLPSRRLVERAVLAGRGDRGLGGGYQALGYPKRST